MLYLISTPIGHLGDITFRALDVLKSCDFILCEDTRHSSILLNHYHISKPLRSYHKFNETSALESILKSLKAGQTICLMSDAGTPLISDPGQKLIEQCIERSIPFTAIPGPCAAIQGLICSGLPTNRFQFYGFLPRKLKQLTEQVREILVYQGTTICYESPHRLKNLLEVIQDLDSERLIVVGRELTKKFEEVQRGVAAALLAHWENKVIKGEIVVMIAPSHALNKEHLSEWANWSIEEHVRFVESSDSLTEKEAIKRVAEVRGVPKRIIYNQFHQTDT